MRHLLAVTTLCAVALSAQNQGLVLQNGNTTHVDVPFSTTLVPTSGITAEAWVTYGQSPLATGWRFPTVFRMDPSANQASYFLRIEAGQTQANRLLWWVSTTNGDFSIGWNFAAGALIPWTHVAGTYDGATLRLFVNGAQVVQGNATGVIQNRGGVFRIGGGDMSVPGGETWNGEIDEVRVWPFARTAAAIGSTMNMQLQAMPGEVSTWNLDGNALDSSGSNHGSGTGSPTFATNTLTLQNVAFPGALNLGAASGCRTTGLAAIPALANVGNSAFGLVGVRAPLNAGGLSLLAMATLPVPLPVLGVDVLVDLNVIGVTRFVLSDALGAVSIGFSIPPNPAYIGLGFYSQFLWLDGTCANGVSASNAVFASIVP